MLQKLSSDYMRDAFNEYEHGHVHGLQLTRAILQREVDLDNKSRTIMIIYPGEVGRAIVSGYVIGRNGCVRNVFFKDLSDTFDEHVAQYLQ